MSFEGGGNITILCKHKIGGSQVCEAVVQGIPDLPGKTEIPPYNFLLIYFKLIN
jgi:hypothetical protein